MVDGHHEITQGIDHGAIQINDGGLHLPQKAIRPGHAISRKDSIQLTSASRESGLLYR